MGTRPLGAHGGLGAATGVTLAAGLAAAALLPAAEAAAQTRIAIEPSVGVSESYSDNVDFVAEDERSGFTTNVTPRLRIGSVGGRLEGFAQYGLNLRYEHFSDGERPGLDHDASARLSYAVSPRWDLILEEDFRLSPDPTQELAFVTPGGQRFRTFEEAARTPGVDVLDLRALRVREDQLRNRLALGTTYDFTPRWSAGLDAIWIVQDSREDLFEEDSETYAGRLRTDYRLTPVDDLRLAVAYDDTDFDVSPDAQVGRADLGWVRRISETLRADLTAGYALVRTPDGEEGGDEELPYLSAELIGLMARGSWRLRAGREVTAGDGSDDVSRRDLVQLSLDRDLGRRVGLAARIAYLRTRSVRGVGTEADTFEGTVSLSWRIIRWVGLRAAYRYRYEDPLGAGGSIDENSGLIGIDVLWPVREMAGLTSQ